VSKIEKIRTKARARTRTRARTKINNKPQTLNMKLETIITTHFSPLTTHNFSNLSNLCSKNNNKNKLKNQQQTTNFEQET
jgi:hypothetical protein